MKRFVRRTSAIALGLVLGWLAAGVAPSIAPSESFAEEHAGHQVESSHAEAPQASADPGHAAPHTTAEAAQSTLDAAPLLHDDHHAAEGQAADHHAAADSHAGDGSHAADAHSDGHGPGPAEAAAGRLVTRFEDVPFFRPVLITAAALFIAALVLGIPALKFRGPEPVDPAARDDHHDDHAHAAHDSHAHDAHGKPAAGHGHH